MKTVVRLSIAPVKSLAQVHPESVRVEPFGVVGNRAFYLVDDRGARVSGPRHGRLMQVRASYDATSERLTLSFPDGSELSASVATLDGAAISSDFWGRTVTARVVDGPFSEALSTWYGQRLRLVRPSEEGAAADVHPLSVMSTASAEALSRSSGGDRRPLDTRRFRLNVELAGCEPFEEDTWEGRLVRFGGDDGAGLRIGGQIPRCAITTYDPDTGQRDFGTLKAIRELRGVSAERELPFGVYAEVARPGTISVGDVVDVSSEA